MACADCGFARIEPFPNREDRAKFYSQGSITERKIKKKRGPAKQAAALIRHHLRRISGRKKGTLFLRDLRNHVPSGSKLLDIGCGTGAILQEARSHYQCTGVEISDYLAGEARKLNVEVKVGDFVTLDFAGEKFDAITMVSLLEHLEEPVLALQKCFDLLDDRGLLLLKTVNHEGINRRLLGAGWSGYRPPDHLVYFGPRTLQTALRHVGFRTVSTRA
ncbi:MAG: class I SAM-dependent methyltransferase, partial [Pseudomonadota bacterium]